MLGNLNDFLIFFVKIFIDSFLFKVLDFEKGYDRVSLLKQ